MTRAEAISHIRDVSQVAANAWLYPYGDVRGECAQRTADALRALGVTDEEMAQ